MSITPEERDLVLAMLGHDLRQPLAVIKLSTSHALQSDDPEVLRRGLRRVELSVGRMTEMIDQLVDFGRIQHGKVGLTLDCQPTDIRPLIRTIVDDFHLLHPRQQITVEYQDSPIGKWDADRLTQVFVNLIGNAVSHGTGEPIHIKISPRGRNVEVLICNYGEVPAELLPDKIWDPYERGYRSDTGGLGLGLYIAKNFVEAHGGSIQIEVKKGQSCFLVSLPQTS